MDQRFGKSYKLVSTKLIELVFSKGRKINKFPVLLRFVETTEDLPAAFQVAISVPKRNFKKAVDRNRVKRLIREAVRKNKHIVEQKTPQFGSKYVLFIIFNDRKFPKYQDLENTIKSLFVKLPAQKDND